jgi:hypothetical protein|tara:strand:+ start:406 stop:864 length:459 start_codon:yes stop_codon:yes gene_type:complete
VTFFTFGSFKFEFELRFSLDDSINFFDLSSTLEEGTIGMIAISSLLFLKKDVKVIGLDLTFSELSLTFGISAIEQLMGSTYFSTFYFLVSIIFALILFLSEIIVDSFLLRFLESILAISSFDCLFSSSFRFYSSSFTFSFSSLDISFAFIFS